MADSEKDDRATASRPWREPYDVLLKFVTSRSPDERERLRPRIAGACREFKKRTYYLKNNWKLHYPDTFLTHRDEELGMATERLLNWLDMESRIDDDARKRIVEACLKILNYKG
jgi:hypothetical protein